MPERERQDDKTGIGEGPFHDRHDMIALHDVLEESQIDGEATLCAHHQQVAEDVAFGFGTSCRRAAQDQYQCSRHAQPSTFFEEMGSLRTMAASIIVMMGIVVVIMLALVGAVMLRPMV